MDFGIVFANTGPFSQPDAAASFALAAEAAGFESLWTVEHVVVPKGYESTYPYDPSGRMPGGEDMAIPDPLIWLSYVAAATSAIRLATGILIVPQRNPVVLAKELATLDFFCGGRALLGVGAGWSKEDFDACGVPFAERGRRTDEAMAALRELWNRPVSNFAGEFSAFKDAYSYPKPVRPGGVPILVGGESKAALRRVARLADGWLPFNLPVADAAATIAALKQMTRDAGRDPEALRIVKIVFSNASLDDLKRYRDAGVTEFNMASSGELPGQGAGIGAKFDEWAQTIVGPVGEL